MKNYTKNYIVIILEKSVRRRESGEEVIEILDPMELYYKIKKKKK